jgi:Skp family chaperone for outer membrane proteins
MHRKPLSIAVFLMTLVLLPSFSADAAGVKIGIIDMTRVIQESESVRDARGVFLMDLESKQTVLRAREGEVRKMQQDLQQKAAELSAKDLKDEQEKIGQEVKNLRRLKADLEEELKKKDRELTAKVLSEIKEVVEAYQKEKKFTLIMERKAVLAFDGAVDITGEIIEAYDAGN